MIAEEADPASATLVPSLKEAGLSGKSTPRQQLPAEASARLQKWLQDNPTRPYPTEEEKEGLLQETGLTFSQLNNWFSNSRRRLGKKHAAE